MRFARGAALALVLGLVAVGGTAASVGVGEDRAGVDTSGADVSVVARADGLHGATARLEREHRRDSLASHRSFKHFLAVAVLLAALAVASGRGARRVVVGAGFRPPLTSWWFRSGGRAPPSFRLSVL